MKTEPITNGQLIKLLLRLGFKRHNLDDAHEVFTESKTRMMFPLPKGDPQTPAQFSNIAGLRVQLHYRGILEQTDFDAALAGTLKVKS